MMLLPRIVHDNFEFGGDGIFNPISSALGANRGRDFPYHDHAETEFDVGCGLSRFFFTPAQGACMSVFFQEVSVHD
jgi:hypothetical protein